MGMQDFTEGIPPDAGGGMLVANTIKPPSQKQGSSRSGNFNLGKLAGRASGDAIAGGEGAVAGGGEAAAGGAAAGGAAAAEELLPLLLL